MSAHSGKLPTSTQKRIDLLDIFRGFAVFGILVVNLEIMNCTFFNQAEFSKQWTAAHDQVSVRILQLFFYSKFFPVFSFLFGLGISMQALKRIERGAKSVGFFFMRMTGLFIIGLLHIGLLWSGDVLHLYALLGLLSVMLLRAPSKLLLAGSLILLIFPFYEQIADQIFTGIGFEPGSFMEGYTSSGVVNIIRHGPYMEGMQLRFSEYLSNIPVLFVFLAPIAMSMFLLGLYFGKQKLVYSIDGLVENLKKPAIAVALITNTYRLIFLFVLPGLPIYADPAYRPLFLKLMLLSDIAMGLFYLWLIALMVKFPRWKRLLNPLRNVGRMALTNYIMHSFIGLILFSSIGFHLYETLSPSATLFTAMAIFCFQVVFSNLWLALFQYGPLEWLWRCFSYRRFLPIRKKAMLTRKLIA